MGGRGSRRAGRAVEVNGSSGSAGASPSQGNPRFLAVTKHKGESWIDHPNEIEAPRSVFGPGRRAGIGSGLPRHPSAPRTRALLVRCVVVVAVGGVSADCAFAGDPSDGSGDTFRDVPIMSPSRLGGPRVACPPILPNQTAGSQPAWMGTPGFVRDCVLREKRKIFRHVRNGRHAA